jgi:hypothetical protein
VREVGEAGRSNPALHCCFLRPSPTAYKERFFPKLLREPLEGPGPVKSKWRGFSPPETALGLTSLMKNNNNAKTRLVWNHKQICCWTHADTGPRVFHKAHSIFLMGM